MNSEQEKLLLAKYPAHIVLMVMAAKQALNERRARIEDGILVFGDPASVGELSKRPPESA